LVNAKIFRESVHRAAHEAVIQLAGIAASLLWSRCQASLSPKVVHAVTGLRFGAEIEEQGFDLRLHGERGYNMDEEFGVTVMDGGSPCAGAVARTETKLSHA
jgi:ammonia channel protein AmtB